MLFLLLLTLYHIWSLFSFLFVTHLLYHNIFLNLSFFFEQNSYKQPYYQHYSKRRQSFEKLCRLALLFCKTYIGDLRCFLPVERIYTYLSYVVRPQRTIFEIKRNLINLSVCHLRGIVVNLIALILAHAA